MLNEQKIIDYLKDNNKYIHAWTNDDWTGGEIEYEIEYDCVENDEMVFVVYAPYHYDFCISIPIKDIKEDLSNFDELVIVAVDKKIDDEIIDDREWGYQL